MSKQHLVENWQFAQLRTRLADQMAQFHPQLRNTLLRYLSELVVALPMAHNVQLSAVGAKLPVNASEEARQQWIRRQLRNDTDDTLQLFRSLAESLLVGFAGRSVRLLLDPTDLAADLTIVQITLAYRGRALPLAWLTTYVKPGGTVKDAPQLLFAEQWTWLPKAAHAERWHAAPRCRLGTPNWAAQLLPTRLVDRLGLEALQLVVG